MYCLHRLRICKRSFVKEPIQAFRQYINIQLCSTRKIFIQVHFAIDRSGDLSYSKAQLHGNNHARLFARCSHSIKVLLYTILKFVPTSWIIDVILVFIKIFFIVFVEIRAVKLINNLRNPWSFKFLFLESLPVKSLGAVQKGKKKSELTTLGIFV